MEFYWGISRSKTWWVQCVQGGLCLRRFGHWASHCESHRAFAGLKAGWWWNYVDAARHLAKHFGSLLSAIFQCRTRTAGIFWNLDEFGYASIAFPLHRLLILRASSTPLGFFCDLLRETQVVLVIVIWFLPTYLILRLLKALPVDFERCRTVPELWEYDFPRFNLVVRVAFVLLLALSLFWSSLTLTSPLVEVLMRKNLTFNAKVALRLALAGILYFGCGVQMFVWIVYLIPTHRALFVKARMPYRPSSYIEIGETHPEFNLAKEVQLAKMFLNLCLCFIGLS